MAANRHRRRAQAARTRHRVISSPAAARPLPLRLAFGAVGVVLIAVGTLAVANPRGYHTGRGLFFLVIAGCVLLVLAVLPP